MTNMIFYNPYSSNVQPKGIVFDYADSCDRVKTYFLNLSARISSPTLLPCNTPRSIASLK